MNLPSFPFRTSRQVEYVTKTIILCSAFACALSMSQSDAYAADKKKAACLDREYSFLIERATYAELLDEFARQAGIGMVGGAPEEGTVTLVTEEPLTFREALSRVRALLFVSDMHEPYTLLFRETHFAVHRLSGCLRMLLVDRMFASEQEFHAAALPPYELALVVLALDDTKIEDLRPLRDFMPDHVRISPMFNGRAVAVFGLARDISRYCQLVKKLGPFLQSGENED